jgi:hypothetical protein
LVIVAAHSRKCNSTTYKINVRIYLKIWHKFLFYLKLSNLLKTFNLFISTKFFELFLNSRASAAATTTTTATTIKWEYN